MSEMQEYLRMGKGKFELSLIKNPVGTYSFVGTVPVELAYVNPTPEKLDARKYGARFGPKTRTYQTIEAAKKAAGDLGIDANFSHAQ